MAPNSSELASLDREEVLRFIVEKERLTKTRNHFGVSKDELRALFLPANSASAVGRSDEPQASAKAPEESEKPTLATNSTTAPKRSPSKTRLAGLSRSQTRRSSKKAAQTNSEAEDVVDESKATESSGGEEDPSSSSCRRSQKTAKGGAMKSKSTAKQSQKQANDAAAASEEETPAIEEEEANASQEEADTEEADAPSSKSSQSSSKSKRKGGRRRQSSPRGRRAVKYDPEDYIYNRLLIYTDGAARGNPGESGAGVVLKTPEGEEVGRFGRYLGRGTNNFAEYQALLLGLQHAQEFGASDITILSDSDLLVRQLCGEYRVRAAHLRVLFDEAQEMLTSFEKYQVKRIEREKNREADSMANRAIDERL